MYFLNKSKVFLIAFTVAMHFMCGAEAKEPLRKIRVVLQWYPQAQFAGFYMAKELGFYRDIGLDVEFVQRHPQQPIISFLRDNKADFITNFLASGIKLRERGEPVVNIAQISQTSALMFIAKKKSGIERIEDFNGRRLGLWQTEFREVPKALLQKHHVNPELVPIASGINLFLWDGIDVLTVMWYNEYFQVLSSGINEDELKVFFFKDYNLDIPEDGIYCRPDFWQKEPELCRNFVIATLEGWNAAFENKTKALEFVKKYCREQHREYNYSQQRWMLDRMQELINVSGKYPGFLSAKTYQECTKKLRSAGVINTIPPYDEFYKYALKQEKTLVNDVQE